jgi:predicted helicase
LYRPFTRKWFFDSTVFVDERGRLDVFFSGAIEKTPCIVVSDPTSQKETIVLAVDGYFDLHLVGAASGAVGFPLWRRHATGESESNIADWAVTQFGTHYQLGRGKSRRPITKEAIFHYVYGVLHDPIYREKYALNLKREFPRIPFYPDFWQWSDWGKTLMHLHIGYESVEPYALKRIDISDEKARKAGLAPKALLKADKEQGRIVLDSETTLSGVPAEAWNYKLGNRCALEWILDQHKEKTPKDPTIRDKFNTYRFADYKDKVIDLLMRVTTVSVETQEIVEAMHIARRGS